MGENFNSGKDENINLTILNEINKAAKMGMDSISYVLKKVCLLYTSPSPRD